MYSLREKYTYDQKLKCINKSNSNNKTSGSKWALAKATQVQPSIYYKRFQFLQGIIWPNGMMGKFEVDAFNCFQNKHFQEAGSHVPPVQDWETGSSLTLCSPQEVWSRSICGEVFPLHFYYVWQWWQRTIHRMKWLMHTLSHSNTLLLFFEPPE